MNWKESTESGYVQPSCFLINTFNLNTFRKNKYPSSVQKSNKTHESGKVLGSELKLVSIEILKYSIQVSPDPLS